jgi:hypothetical protein
MFGDGISGYARGMAEDDERDATHVAGIEVHPPEGEQEKSHESEDTLSPDEKSGGNRD